jgi:hypothetical protein
MNPSQAIKESLIALATIAGKELNAVALNAYVDAMSDLDPNDVLRALKDWLRTGKGFPYPADIRAKVMPELDDEDDAQDIANTVIKCISTCGYTNQDRAEEQIGPRGWVVVQRMGGWKHLCETTTHQNEGFLRAQIRDYAQTISKKLRRGELEAMPSLPSPKDDVKQIVQSTFKEIE